MGMSPDRENFILTKLAGHAGGATAKMLAPDLGMPSRQASECLGRLFFAGKVDRERMPQNGVRTHEYLYKLKSETPPLAPPSPPAWEGARIAERETERA